MEADGNGIQRMQQKYNCSIVQNFRKQVLEIQNATTEAIANIRAEITKAVIRETNSNSAKLSLEKSCPVCGENVGLYSLVGCNHIACKSCYIQMYTIQIKEGNLPLLCLDSECKKGITIKDISYLFTEKEHLQLYSTSLDMFVSVHSKEYGNCFTPDCEQVFKISDFPTGNTKFSCDSCSKNYCVCCKCEYHEGITCEESKANNSESEKLFAKWRQNSGAQQCPQCSITIEKNDGCNHMTCLKCKAHFCWKCPGVKQFWNTAQECYAHLIEKHGGVFDIPPLIL